MRPGPATKAVVAWCALSYAASVAVFGAAAALAYEMKDCEQQDSSPLALRACTELLKAGDLDDATRVRLWFRRGQAWMIEDEASEAVADFTQMLALAPKHIKGRTSRARANTLLGNHVAAVQDWSALIELKPEPADLEALYLERGASELAAGNTNAAMADYDTVLKSDPKSIKAHVGRAGVYQALNNRDKFMEEIAAARVLDPGEPISYFELAEAAERWGDTKLAIENYITALKMNPRGFWNARKALKRLGVDSPP